MDDFNNNTNFDYEAIFNQPLSESLSDALHKYDNYAIRKNLLHNFEIDEMEFPIDFEISRKTHFKSICTHVAKEGARDVLEVDPQDPNYYICKYCGARIKIIDIEEGLSKQEIQSKVDELINIIQIIKIMAVDFPDKYREYFHIIPMLELLPDLYEMSVNKFKIASSIDSAHANDLLNKFINSFADSEEESFDDDADDLM